MPRKTLKRQRKQRGGGNMKIIIPEDDAKCFLIAYLSYYKLFQAIDKSEYSLDDKYNQKRTILQLKIDTYTQEIPIGIIITLWFDIITMLIKTNYIKLKDEYTNVFKKNISTFKKRGKTIIETDDYKVLLKYAIHDTMFPNDKVLFPGYDTEEDFSSLKKIKEEINIDEFVTFNLHTPSRESDDENSQPEKHISENSSHTIGNRKPEEPSSENSSHTIGNRNPEEPSSPILCTPGIVCDAIVDVASCAVGCVGFLLGQGGTRKKQIHNKPHKRKSKNKTGKKQYK
jgi:hypothetical protein